MQIRVGVLWLLASFATVIGSAAVWGQQPKGKPVPPDRGAGTKRPAGFRGGFTFDRLLERHDGDKDGKVTRKEWQGPEQVFGQMDQDDDGVITEEEFQAGMRARSGVAAGRGSSGGRAAPPQEPQKLDGTQRKGEIRFFRHTLQSTTKVVHRLETSFSLTAVPGTRLRVGLRVGWSVVPFSADAAIFGPQDDFPNARPVGHCG